MHNSQISTFIALRDTSIHLVIWLSHLSSFSILWPISWGRFNFCFNCEKEYLYSGHVRVLPLSFYLFPIFTLPHLSDGANQSSSKKMLINSVVSQTRKPAFHKSNTRPLNHSKLCDAGSNSVPLRGFTSHGTSFSPSPHLPVFLVVLPSFFIFCHWSIFISVPLSGMLYLFCKRHGISFPTFMAPFFSFLYLLLF